MVGLLTRKLPASLPILYFPPFGLTRRNPEFRGDMPQPVCDVMVKLGPYFFEVLIPSPITLSKDEDGNGIFELHPDFENASAKSWVWVVAVRTGLAANLMAMWLDSESPCFDPEVWQAYSKTAREKIGFRAALEATRGPDIYELVAVSANFSKVLGRMTFRSPVIGGPVYPEISNELPQRIFKTVKGWLEEKCGGAVLIGSDEENYDWMSRCDGGIVCDDVAHGQAVRKRLQRPYMGPSVLVAQ
jgi:hypothetical protein